MILHIVDASANEPWRNYEIVRNEIEKYGKFLYKKPEVVALNKSDRVEASRLNDIIREFKKHRIENIFAISAGTKQGCRELTNHLAKYVRQT